jgi:hypothetical protein
MGEALAGFSLAVQLAPLVPSGYKKLRLICSPAERQKMVNEYHDVRKLYAGVRKSVRNLEGEMQTQFTWRMRQVRKTMKWLSVLAVESSSRRSRRGRFKQRIHKWTVFLCSSGTLERVRGQMDRVLSLLTYYEG